MADDKVEEIKQNFPGGLVGVLLLIVGIVITFVLYFAFVTNDEIPGESSFENNVAVSVAKQTFAENQSIADTSDIEVVSVEEHVWPDSCLGLISVDEACAQVETDGYRIELSHGSKSEIYRTNLTGSTTRVEFID